MPVIKNMHIVEQAVDDVIIPRFVKVRQVFPAPVLTDIPGTLRNELAKHEIKERIKPGQKVAICVGSRGIANIATITRETVSYVKELGATPIIIPTMGSHGTATAEGQRAILAEFGITEEAMGAEIVSCMDVVEVGRIADGTPVFVDKHLPGMDAVIIVNRIKPHTSFSGPIESGIIKMSVIGLGKHKGAETCHQLSFKNFANRLLEMSRIVFKTVPIVFGVALIENPYDETAEIHCVPAEKVEEIEPVLLEKAKSYMPRILFNPLDVLIVDEIGKNISGSGADPNVTGKFTSEHKKADFTPPRRIVIRDLTPETEGSAVGMGQADFVTQRLYDKFDLAKTYINCITSTLTINGLLPMVMRNDYYAIKAAMKTCNLLNLNDARIVRIKNTLKIEEIYISENLLPEAKVNPNIEILTGPFELKFDEEGYIVD
ncbi:lactate racemase domain-containing protein [Thermanaerosceptrum fracticalcis]|nr:lactate racemase domain-containing protein [Thermanaerosceptrum fracticalcis]